MEAIRILDKSTAITWDYDEDADVLYLSLGEPRPAVGVDIGEGVIVRYDEVRQEVVGLTLLGFASPATPRTVYTPLSRCWLDLDCNGDLRSRSQRGNYATTHRRYPCPCTRYCSVEHHERWSTGTNTAGGTASCGYRPQNWA